MEIGLLEHVHEQRGEALADRVGVAGEDDWECCAISGASGPPRSALGVPLAA
jgi:hypothetical protein